MAIPVSKSEAKRLAFLRSPWRYFSRVLIVCFLLGLAGAGAAAGSERCVHPEWSAATFVFFGVGISFAYAAILSFMSVGCALVIVCSRTDRVKWLFRSLGFVPLALCVAMLLSLYYGGDDPVGRLMPLLPFVWGGVIVFFLSVFVLSCFGWKHYLNRKRGEQAVDGNPH